jgi:Na+-transporting NADH:ubiquinone oxidoreductase subunit NqrB
MSVRYYLITTVLVLALTAAISIWREKHSWKEILGVMVQVIAALVLIAALVAGGAKLLEMLGIAQSGFNL